MEFYYEATSNKKTKTKPNEKEIMFILWNIFLIFGLMSVAYMTDPNSWNVLVSLLWVSCIYYNYKLYEKNRYGVFTKTIHLISVISLFIMFIEFLATFMIPTWLSVALDIVVLFFFLLNCYRETIYFSKEIKNDRIYKAYRRPRNLIEFTHHIFCNHGGAKLYYNGVFFGYHNGVFDYIPSENYNRYYEECEFELVDCNVEETIKNIKGIIGTKWSLWNNCFAILNKVVVK